jgi:AraC-like DNA-binding protein
MGSAPGLDFEAAAKQNLVFHDHEAVVDRDPQVLANRLAQHYSVLDFGARPGFESSFLHRTATAQAGQLLLSCGLTTPIMGKIGRRDGVGSVNLLFSGSLNYGGAGQEFLVNQQRPLFFAPSEEYSYLIEDHFNGVVFDVDLQRLRQTAAAMAGLGVSERRFAGDLELMRAICPSPAPVQQLMRVLCRSFRMLDCRDLGELHYLEHLQVDDLIYRTLALLLSPSLRKILQEDPARPLDRVRIFDELLDWIRSNLCSRIALSDLERVSGYSRRNLQLAFQQRFGCGPIQWIRQQRLEHARRALLTADQSQSVAAIASRYGFSSASAFSRDFRAQFALSPSALLREGLRRTQ